jgi:hypothetical protein
MSERRPEKHITYPRITGMEMTNRRQRSMETSSEGGQDPEGAVEPWTDGISVTKATTLTLPTYYS